MKARGRIGLAVAGVAVAAAGAAAGQTDAAGEQPGVVLASGQLTSASGKPTPGSVRVYAWPIHEGTITLPLLGTAKAGRDGRFTLRSARAAQLARLAGKKGSVDLIVQGDTGRAGAETVFSSRVRSTAGGLVASAARAGGDQPPPFLRLRAKTPAGANASSGGPPCSQYREEKLGGKQAYTVIGELNNAYGDTESSFSYGASADSEIGVAVAAKGKGWDLDGSTHIGNTTSASVGKTRKGRYAKRFYSVFRYAKYKEIGGCLPSPRYRIRAEEWRGGLRSHKQRGTLGRCNPGYPYEGGSTVTRTSKKAVSWSRGVSVFGVGLTVRSGFSKWVQTQYKFGGPDRRKHWVCGSHGESPFTAKRIFSGR